MAKTKPTPATTEGPYYKKGSPGKTVTFEEGVPGEALELSGLVLDLEGKPVAGAWLDFWQADGSGHYDNAGYILRGHQSTGPSGRYTLKTVVPGAYPGRTPHIHVKVRPGDRGRILTTQLFFPGVASNSADPIFNQDLLVSVSNTSLGKTATFDFVLGRD